MKEYTPSKKVISRTLDKPKISRSTSALEILQHFQTPIFQQHPTDVLQRLIVFQNARNKSEPLRNIRSYDDLKNMFNRFGDNKSLDKLSNQLITNIKSNYAKDKEDSIFFLDLPTLKRFINSILSEDDILIQFSYISNKLHYEGKEIKVTDAINTLYDRIQTAVTHEDYIEAMRDHLTPAPVGIFDDSDISSQLSNTNYKLLKAQIQQIQEIVPNISRGTLENAMNTLARPRGQNGIKIFGGIYELKIMSMGDYRLYGNKVGTTVTFKKPERGLGH